MKTVGELKTALDAIDDDAELWVACPVIGMTCFQEFTLIKPGEKFVVGIIEASEPVG